MWFIRRAVPESPRWLVAHGRLAAAEAVTAAIERRVEIDLGAALPAAAPATSSRAAAAATGSSGAGFVRIFQAPYLSRTLMLMVFNFAQTIGYYGFASWVPTLLIARGVTTTTSLGYSFAIALAAPVGPALVMRLADGLDRRWQIVWSAAAIAAFGLVFAGRLVPA